MSSNRFAVILAAGKGTRMKSKMLKVLHQVCGKPMIEHVLGQVKEAGVEEIITIMGHDAQALQNQLGTHSEFAMQKEQLGTGHAVMQAASFLEGKEGVTLVVCGDTPLISAETMDALLKHHLESNAKATVLTACADDPTGYGRIVRDIGGHVERIVEHKDATDEEREITEINTGTFCFDNQLLFEALKKVTNDNSQGEYYLTDVLEILRSQGEIISAYQTADFEETLGINDRLALSRAEKYMKQRINEKHMLGGVTIVDPDNTHISADATIGCDTIIYPGTVIFGTTEIGTGCKIGPNTEIINCQVGNDTVLKHSVVEESKIGNGVSIGPFAHIRPLSDIRDTVKIGNFVEVKKSVIDEDSKVSHLTYIGDAEIGKKVNLGCGIVTVNYDGKNKFKTIVEDEAFIGCNTNLVAPVTVKKGAYVAAGSTITTEVPEDAFAIARAKQVNKEGYANIIREKQQQK